MEPEIQAESFADAPEADEEWTIESPKVTAAVRAALRRVRPDLKGVDFEVELAWQLRTVCFPGRGKKAIVWSRLGIGCELKRCLSEAQNHRCCYCGRRMEEASFNRAEVATFEHVIPLARGGPDHPDNIVIACHGCNDGRGIGYYPELHGAEATGLRQPRISPEPQRLVDAEVEGECLR